MPILDYMADHICRQSNDTEAYLSLSGLKPTLKTTWVDNRKTDFFLHLPVYLNRGLQKEGFCSSVKKKLKR